MQIKDWLVKQIRRIKWIADRLDLQSAKSESKKLNARLKAGLDAAKARNATKNELDDIQGQASAEYEVIWHPIYARDSERLSSTGTEVLGTRSAFAAYLHRR